MSSLLEAPVGDEAAIRRPLPPAVAGTPGFLRQAEDAARWRRPRVRASLVVAAALLIGTFAHPDRRAVPRRLHGTVAAGAADTGNAVRGAGLRRIEPLRRARPSPSNQVGWQVEGGDAYRLSLTLHNRGQVDIALPSVDLSVTDNSGTLVSRRALAPADFRTATGGSVPAWRSHPDRKVSCKHC